MDVRSFVMAILLALTPLVGCTRSPLSPSEQAKSMFREGDWDGVIATCTTTLAERPGDVESLTLRGQSYLIQKRYEDAIADFSRIIEVSPDDSEGYYLRQIAYQRAGQNELAEADGDAGRKRDPRYQTAYLYESSNFTDTSVPLKQLVERDPDEQTEDRPHADRRDDTGEQGPDNSDLADSESPAADDAPPSRSVLTGVERPTPEQDGPQGLGGLSVEKDGSGRIVQKLDAGPRQPQPPGTAVPPPPEAPQEPGEPQPPAAPGTEPADQDLHDKWIADQHRKGVRPNEILVPNPEPGAEPAGPLVPPSPLSTSLPPTGVAQPGLSAAPGIAKPRATGISSQTAARNTPAAVPSVVSNPRLRPDLPEHSGGLASPTRFLPGQFRGNTLYTPGRPQPPLSTSLPGTTGKVPGGVVPRSGSPATQQPPVLSTQLPPDRVVRPAAGRPTGIQRKNRPPRP